MEDTQSFLLESVNTKELDQVIKSATNQVKNTYARIGTQVKGIIQQADTLVISDDVVSFLQHNKATVTVTRKLPEELLIVKVFYPYQNRVSYKDAENSDIEKSISGIKVKNWSVSANLNKEGLNVNIAQGRGTSGIVALEHIDQMMSAIESEDQDAFNDVFDQMMTTKAQELLAERKVDLTSQIFSTEAKENWWTVTMIKPAAGLKKGQTVDVKSNGSANAIKKGLIQMKVDPKLIPSNSVDAVLAK